MKLINKFVFGTMSIKNNKESLSVLNFALNNFKIFHLSSEYESFDTVSKVIREKKKLN
tara:strand:+ start:171 stop:344 length:174 start_codon:yes stop_codon:yes gene_type:complete